MKIFIYVLFAISLILIISGYIIEDINSEKFIGGGTFLLFFLVIPLFLYYRWQNKKLKDFILDNEEIGQNTLGVQLNLKGRPVIEVETSGGRLDVDAVAGSQSDLIMIVKNTGSGEAGTVRFLSQAPQYWSIQYDPSQVIDLKPGDQAEVTASIIPPDKTIPGDYYIRSVASTVLGQTELNLRVNVARSEAFGAIGILIILAVVGANLALFYRMSTR